MAEEKSLLQISLRFFSTKSLRNEGISVKNKFFTRQICALRQGAKAPKKFAGYEKGKVFYMKNENTEIKDEKNEKHKYQTLGMSIGMCFGVSLGMSIGYFLFDNGPVGMCMGMSIGMFLGMTVGMAKDKRMKEQFEEKGYKILEINQKDEKQDEYLVKIIDKTGQENTVVVTKGDMDTEEFEVGDLVYLDEDGSLEQIFDKEGEKNG